LIVLPMSRVREIVEIIGAARSRKQRHPIMSYHNKKWPSLLALGEAALGGEFAGLA